MKKLFTDDLHGTPAAASNGAAAETSEVLRVLADMGDDLDAIKRLATANVTLLSGTEVPLAVGRGIELLVVALITRHKVLLAEFGADGNNQK
jgi:hypothetical protein